MSARRWLVLAVVVVVLGGAALLGLALGRPEGAVGSPVVGQSAPPLAGKTLDGGRFEMRPGRNALTVVNIWASWCGPCRDELPMLAEAARDWEDADVRLVTVNTRDGPVSARSLLHEVGARDLLTVLDPTGQLALEWGATGVPETFVVDRQGVVRGRQVGAVSAEWLEEQVRRWS